MKNDFLILSFFLHILGGVNPGLEVKTHRQGTTRKTTVLSREDLSLVGLKPSSFVGSF